MALDSNILTDCIYILLFFADCETNAPGWQSVHGDQFTKEPLSILEPENKQEATEVKPNEMTILGQVYYKATFTHCD